MANLEKIDRGLVLALSIQVKLAGVGVEIKSINKSLLPTSALELGVSSINDKSPNLLYFT